MNEHISDIVVTFSHEFITSISLKTDQDNCVDFGVFSSATSISKLDPSSPELNVVFGFETNFSEDALKEIFLYRGAVIKRKKSATVISAEKYHKLVLKNNNDGLFETSPNKNSERKINDFKDGMMKRLNEMQGNTQEIEEKLDTHEKSVEEVWNEERLADQEKAQYEDEMDKEVDKIFKGKRGSCQLKSPKLNKSAPQLDLLRKKTIVKN